MKRIYLIIFVILPFFILISQVNAAYLYFEPQNKTVGVNNQFDILVKINTEGKSPLTTDAVILYDSINLTLLDITQALPENSFFPRIVKNIKESRAYIGGMIDTGTEPKSGDGILAILKFKSNKSGQNLITFSCAPGKTTDSNISVKENDKIIDVIDCSKINQSTITISEDNNISITSIPGTSQSPTASNRTTPAVNTPMISPTAITTIFATTSPIISLIPSLTFTPTETLFPTLGPTLDATMSASLSATPIGSTPSATLTPIPTLEQSGIVTYTFLFAAAGVVLLGASLLVKLLTGL